MTTQTEIRDAFWKAHPLLPRKRITAYSGFGLMWPTDVRCAFVDFVDHLQKSGEITAKLAERVTL